MVTVPGMPPVANPANLYSETTADKFQPPVAGALPRVYVPNRMSGDVTVIDPATFKVVDTFKVGINPQHVVPSWDLKTLWVANNAEGRTDGSLTPVDPKTGKPGRSIPVDDPYNMYFTPDGKSAIIVAEALKRLDFRDAQTMTFQSSLATPQCAGINHADFSIDGRYAIFTCEFQGRLVKIDLVNRKVLGYVKLPQRAACPRTFASPPTARSSTSRTCTRTGCSWLMVTPSPKSASSRPAPGRTDFTPAAMARSCMSSIAVPIRSLGRHVARAACRSSTSPPARSKSRGQFPGGGSPDMGNVSADGKYLWLSGRFDNVAYAINTTTGEVKSIPVGKEPHGLTVWPQPGRYSLGHTGNLR